MWKSALPKACFGLALCAAAGLAQASGVILQRGYDTCVGDLEDAYPRHSRLMHARWYYHAQSPEDMTYFINSTAWQSGDRIAVRTRCSTDRFGRRLLERRTTAGTWMPRQGNVTIDEVASGR